MEVIGSGLRRSFDCRPEKRGAKGIAFVSKVPNDGEGILRWHEHTTSHAHTNREGPKLPDRTRMLIRTSSIHPPRLGAGFIPTIHLVHANRLKSKRQRSKRTDLANSRIPSRQPSGQADVGLAHGKMRSACNIRDDPSTNIAAQFDFQHDCLTHGLFEDLAVRGKYHWKRNSFGLAGDVGSSRNTRTETLPKTKDRQTPRALRLVRPGGNCHLGERGSPGMIHSPGSTSPARPRQSDPSLRQCDGISSTGLATKLPLFC